ncbi:fibronectin type III domain-containing protein [Geobacter pickeringii]|uniref:Fibronectin type-III domain-containing protein n=1 Tax=Geobacter pickeringii TaxID=345632 RepID=A0A0B5B6M3_9BACT|nr:fibronectin type III domain-containing protein [Geobacter pickeringii]AJE02188.1 hypothetical protein GPICK_01295 [Geobacter pickeringii]
MKKTTIIARLFLPLLLMAFFAGCGGGGGSAGNSATGGGTPSTDSSAANPGGGTTSAPATGSGSGGSTAATGSVTLAWDAPSGPSTAKIAGYKVYYGTASRTYSKTVKLGLATTCSVTGLASGTYYFTVTAYDAAGNESPYSNETTQAVS